MQYSVVNLTSVNVFEVFDKSNFCVNCVHFVSYCHLRSWSWSRTLPSWSWSWSCHWWSWSWSWSWSWHCRSWLQVWSLQCNPTVCRKTATTITITTETMTTTTVTTTTTSTPITTIHTPTTILAFSGQRQSWKTPRWAWGKQVHGMWYYSLLCFDTVGWATGRASGL